MPYIYEYTGSDQELTVVSDEPRPDLLFWSYWREVPASEHQAAYEPEPAPEPETAGDEQVPLPEVEAKPARKPRTPRAPKVTEAE